MNAIPLSRLGQTQVCVCNEAILLKQNHEAWACPHEAFAPQKWSLHPRCKFEVRMGARKTILWIVFRQRQAGKLGVTLASQPKPPLTSSLLPLTYYFLPLPSPIGEGSARPCSSPKRKNVYFSIVLWMQSPCQGLGKRKCAFAMKQFC